MQDFLTWNPFAWPLLASLLLAVFALLADRRRARRWRGGAGDRPPRLDRVGFMPWGTISLLAIGATLILAALALKAGSG